MAQLLLEKEYNCKFYEEADKRMNIEPVEIDKHTPGIDVPGIRMADNQVKFVVCEVKASEDELHISLDRLSKLYPSTMMDY